MRLIRSASLFPVALALAGAALWAVRASEADSPGAGISCPSGVETQKEVPMELARKYDGADRRPAPIDAVRPGRTEVATFGLG